MTEPLPARLRPRIAELDGWLREWGETRTTQWRLDADGLLRCEVSAAGGWRFEVSAEQGVVSMLAGVLKDGSESAANRGLSGAKRGVGG